MEQNNLGVKSLIQKVEEEQRQFWRKNPHLLPQFTAPRADNLSDVERRILAAKNKLSYDIKDAATSYFRQALKDVKSYKSLLGLPMTLAYHSTMGSTAVIKMVGGAADLLQDWVEAFGKEFRCMRYEPNIPMLVGEKLTQPIYISSTTNYAEVVWLHIFCSWLGCVTGAMNLEVRDLMERSKNDEEFSFYQRIQDDYRRCDPSTPEAARISNLQYTVTQQYTFLEQILNRL
jgi:hypothetical protein